jgi:putative salt-induced outer membrane protein
MSRLALPVALLAFTLSAIAPARAETTPAKPFTNESEAGIVVTGGNSKSRSYNFKQSNSYEFDGNVLRFAGRFLGTKANGVESARSWDLGLRYERILSDRLSVFAGEKLESDVFAGYLQRYNTDVGAKYSIVKQEGLDWLAELGYRYVAEHRLSGPDKNSHFARVYSEANRAWNAGFSTKLWVELLPNFTDSSGYLLNTELSASAVLTSILSLKTGYLLKYNNLPAPGVAEKSDSQFTTSLVAKF